MPVTSATPIKSYTGNGVTTVFSYDFRILKDTDLKVTVGGVTKTLTTDYTVSGVGDSGGGNVTFVSAPANGAAIVFERNASYDRTTDYQRGGGFDEETVDKDFDRSVMLVQQIKAILDRVPQIKSGLTLTQPSLPDPVSQRFLRWKSDLSGFENFDIALIGALAISDFMKTVLDDANAAAARTTLGLGTVATYNVGTGAAQVPTNADIVSVPTGTMLDFGGTAAPTGYLLCDGANVSRTTYAALFTAIGTTWGVGDGSTTFGMPDMRRRASVGSGGTGTATLGNAVGNTGGAETHALTTGEMPAHTHFAHTPNAGGGQYIGTMAGTDQTPVDMPTSSTGGGGTHNNMQPSAVVLKIIKT